MFLVATFLFWTGLHYAASVYQAQTGPSVLSTKGTVWPHPQFIMQTNDFLVIRPDDFSFNIVQYNCDTLQNAVTRYMEILKKNAIGNLPESLNFVDIDRWWPRSYHFNCFLGTLFIQLLAPCEVYPHIHMNETYELQINSKDYEGTAYLVSHSIWGILRGLETFVQLTMNVGNQKDLIIKSSVVKDYPRFPHRGLMLDTSRHFLPKATILKMLSAMECNKLNVLHWHIVDDQSFPFSSLTYPSLSGRGAFHPSAFIYTHQDVKEIIEYARLRGIRVIPEFDTPGHTQSWGKGIPNLLTKCYSGGSPNGKFGPIDPSYEPIYNFLENLFLEVLALFPETYVHLGGDEVDFTCWESNENITKFMAFNNITGSYDKLEDLYMQKLLRIINNIHAGRHMPMVWQEVFQHGVHLSANTIVHVWTGNRQSLLNQVTAAGLPVILSTCWYLDHFALDIYAGGGDWRKFYNCEPMQFNGTPKQKQLVFGGEACMWGEYVDETNIIPRVWPRTSAAAEKLWSSMYINDTDKAASRLEEHVCRMRRRGIAAQPANGPGACL